MSFFGKKALVTSAIWLIRVIGAAIVGRRGRLRCATAKQCWPSWNGSTGATTRLAPVQHRGCRSHRAFAGHRAG